MPAGQLVQHSCIVSLIISAVFFCIIFRRMFPSFCLSAIGLNMDVKYAMKLVFKSDDKRYKYVNSKWAMSGKAESHIDEFLSYKHPDSNSTGKSWTYNKISFKKVKLTNSKTPKKGQVCTSVCI